MKIFGSVVLCAALMSGFAMYAQDQTPTSAGDSAVGTSADSVRDKQFLQHAAEGNFAEIELGKLAAQKGNSDEVKKAGQQMVDDHTMLATKMKPMMEKYSVREVKELTKEDKEELAKLQSLSGDEFDKEYIAAMAKDHHKDVKEFRAEIQSTGDTELRAAAVDAGKTIAAHTRMFYGMAKTRGIPTPSFKKNS